jgi:hypothetical protein
MSMEVSVTSKPILPVVGTQVARSTKELIPVKPAEGASPAPSTAKHSPLDKPAQAKMALPVGPNQHRPSPTTGGSGTQSGSMPANPVSGPSPNPTSGTEAGKKDLASTPKRGGESQASDTNLILNKDNENPTSGVGDPEDHQETALADEIKELWSSQKRKGASLRRSRVELETLRSSLPERLHTYKDLLARTGRGGKWTEFLRQANISRTTADRYVEKWKLSTSPKAEKRPSGAFNEPSKEEITDMVKKLRPKLVRVLTTPDSVALFMTELVAALQPSTSIV